MAKSFIHAFYHPGTEPTDVEVRSYSTVDNLYKGLEKLGFADHRHFVVKTFDDRFTAIFPSSNFSQGGYIGLYSQHGFMTIG